MIDPDLKQYLDQKFDAIDQKFVEHDGRFDRLERQLREFRKDMADRLTTQWTVNRSIETHLRDLKGDQFNYRVPLKPSYSRPASGTCPRIPAPLPVRCFFYPVY